MFQSFSFATQCSKKINRKIFLGRQHENENFDASRNIVQEAVGDCFLEKNGKKLSRN